MRLIVTEKNNSAKKIADILGGGEAKADKSYKVPFYTWTDGDGEQMTIGLKGHVVSPAFPEGYSNWQETDLHELIERRSTKEPTDKNVVKAITQGRQGRRRDRDRDRLRPRGRADRARGARGDRRGEPGRRRRASSTNARRSSAPATRR